MSSLHDASLARPSSHALPVHTHKHNSSTDFVVDRTCTASNEDFVLPLLLLLLLLLPLLAAASAAAATGCMTHSTGPFGLFVCERKTFVWCCLDHETIEPLTTHKTRYVLVCLYPMGLVRNQN